MSKLETMLKNLEKWQKLNKGRAAGRCLEAVRYSLAGGLALPEPQPRPNNTALYNMDMLARCPEAYKWKQWRHADHPGEDLPMCLLYFKKCGFLPDGRVAGHIAIYNPETGWHCSNTNYRLSEWWKTRIVGAFVPLDT